LIEINMAAAKIASGKLMAIFGMESGFTVNSN